MFSKAKRFTYEVECATPKSGLGCSKLHESPEEKCVVLQGCRSLGSLRKPSHVNIEIIPKRCFSPTNPENQINKLTTELLEAKVKIHIQEQQIDKFNRKYQSQLKKIAALYERVLETFYQDLKDVGAIEQQFLRTASAYSTEVEEMQRQHDEEIARIQMELLTRQNEIIEAVLEERLDELSRNITTTKNCQHGRIFKRFLKKLNALKYVKEPFVAIRRIFKSAHYM